MTGWCKGLFDDRAAFLFATAEKRDVYQSAPLTPEAPEPAEPDPAAPLPETVVKGWKQDDPTNLPAPWHAGIEDGGLRLAAAGLWLITLQLKITAPQSEHMPRCGLYVNCALSARVSRTRNFQVWETSRTGSYQYEGTSFYAPAAAGELLTVTTMLTTAYDVAQDKRPWVTFRLDAARVSDLDPDRS